MQHIAFVAFVAGLSLLAGTGNMTLIVIMVTGAGASALLLAILTHGMLERAMFRFATGRSPRVGEWRFASRKR